MRTEEFVVEGVGAAAAEPTKGRIQWVIITLNKEKAGQDKKSLIAEIVKAVRQEDEKQKKESKPKPANKPKKVKVPPVIPMGPSPMPPYNPPAIPHEYTHSFNVLHNYVSQGFWRIIVPPTIMNQY